jgi:hypothetical protein
VHVVRVLALQSRRGSQGRNAIVDSPIARCRKRTAFAIARDSRGVELKARHASINVLLSMNRRTYPEDSTAFLALFT